MPTHRWILVFLTVGFLSATACLRADQVEMQNGDRYAGTVVSLNSDSLVLQSEVLGKVLLSRSQVAVITLGGSATAAIVRSTPATNVPPAANVTITNSEIADAFRKLGSATNFIIPKIRDQFLSTAGPEANAKFNDLMSGLMSGQIDMNGLRAQAQSSIDQLKALRAQGGEGSESMDMYLGILESFLKESETVSPAKPKTPAH